MLYLKKTKKMDRKKATDSPIMKPILRKKKEEQEPEPEPKSKPKPKPKPKRLPKEGKPTYFKKCLLLYADNFAVHGDMIVSEGEIYGFTPLTTTTKNC